MKKKPFPLHTFLFQQPGKFQNHLIFTDKNRNSAWNSILYNERPEVRDIIEAWLADSIFDTSGTPRTSLFENMRKKRRVKKHKMKHSKLSIKNRTAWESDAYGD